MHDEESIPEMLDHPMTCPHCGATVIVSSPMETIIFARRNCTACSKEFLIEDGKPKAA
jgi:transposase-like protein